MGIRDAGDTLAERQAGDATSVERRAPEPAPAPPRPAPTARNSLSVARPAHEVFDLPAPHVEEVRTREAFAALREDWNRLLPRAQNDQVFYRHELLGAWLEHFAPAARVRVLTLRSGSGRLCAVLPLLERRSTCLGLPVRELSSPTNAHSCRFDMVAEDAPSAGAAFLRHLQQDPEWDLLRLEDVPHGGQAWSLQRAAEDAGLPVGSEPTMHSPYVLLPTSAPQLQQQWSKNLRAGLRRRRRRLEEQGPVEVECVRGGALLADRLAEGFALEQRGWKGHGGTAIAQDPRTLGFYTQLAQAAAAGGFLRLYFLRSQGRTLAFDYALGYGRRYLSLKPAYDEEHGALSPGQLLTAATLEDLVAHGFEECDLLGHATPAKQAWADRLRPHSRLLVFRAGRLGRALHAARLRGLPRLKLLARWRPWTR